MTSNQIEYFKHQETTRHNRAMEELQSEQNKYAKQQANAASIQAKSAKLRAETEAAYAGTYAKAQELSSQASWLSATSSKQRADTESAYAQDYATAALTNASASWLNATTTTAYAPYYASAAMTQASASQLQALTGAGRLDFERYQYADTGRQHIRVQDAATTVNTATNVGQLLVSGYNAATNRKNANTNRLRSFVDALTGVGKLLAR